MYSQQMGTSAEGERMSSKEKEKYGIKRLQTQTKNSNPLQGC